MTRQAGLLRSLRRRQLEPKVARVPQLDLKPFNRIRDKKPDQLKSFFSLHRRKNVFDRIKISLSLKKSETKKCLEGH